MRATVLEYNKDTKELKVRVDNFIEAEFWLFKSKIRNHPKIRINRLFSAPGSELIIKCDSEKDLNNFLIILKDSSLIKDTFEAFSQAARNLVATPAPHPHTESTTQVAKIIGSPHLQENVPDSPLDLQKAQVKHALWEIKKLLSQGIFCQPIEELEKNIENLKSGKDLDDALTLLQNTQDPTISPMIRRKIAEIRGDIMPIDAVVTNLQHQITEIENKLTNEAHSVMLTIYGPHTPDKKAIKQALQGYGEYAGKNELQNFVFSKNINITHIQKQKNDIKKFKTIGELRLSKPNHQPIQDALSKTLEKLNPKQPEAPSPKLKEKKSIMQKIFRRP